MADLYVPSKPFFTWMDVFEELAAYYYEGGQSREHVLEHLKKWDEVLKNAVLHGELIFEHNGQPFYWDSGDAIHWVQITFPTDSFHRWLEKHHAGLDLFAVKDDKQSDSSIVAETRCEVWLTERMRSEEKPQLKKPARQKRKRSSLQARGLSSEHGAMLSKRPGTVPGPNRAANRDTVSIHQLFPDGYFLDPQLPTLLAKTRPLSSSIHSMQRGKANEAPATT